MEILRREEMLRLLKCSSATLWRLEKVHKAIPQAIRKPGMAPYWLKAEVEAALVQR